MKLIRFLCLSFALIPLHWQIAKTQTHQGRIEHLCKALYSEHAYDLGKCLQSTGKETIRIAKGITLYTDTCRCEGFRMYSQRLLNANFTGIEEEESYNLWVNGRIFEIFNGPTCSNFHDLPVRPGDSLRYFYGNTDAAPGCNGQFCLVEYHYLMEVGAEDTLIHEWESMNGLSAIGDINENGIPDYIFVDYTDDETWYECRDMRIGIVEVRKDEKFELMKDKNGKEYEIQVRANPSWFDCKSFEIRSHHWIRPLPTKYR